MEKRECQRKKLILVFSTILRKTLMPSFKLNVKGGIVTRTLDECIDGLEAEYGSELSSERMVDFCVCQTYAISKFGPDYIGRWSITHSFGDKAMSRFKDTSKGKKYYEDQWLQSNGISRQALLLLIADRRKHPQYQYIYPAYEDHTKERLINTDVGYYICGHSTLLWTPFSPACQKCTKTNACKIRTQEMYPELYRIRLEEYETK